MFRQVTPVNEILRHSAVHCAQKIKFGCIPKEGFGFSLDFGNQVHHSFHTAKDCECKRDQFSGLNGSICMMDHSYSCTCTFGKASKGISMGTVENVKRERISESAILDPRFEYENPPFAWLGIVTSVMNCNA